MDIGQYQFFIPPQAGRVPEFKMFTMCRKFGKSVYFEMAATSGSVN